jgi:hypothetical protein
MGKKKKAKKRAKVTLNAPKNVTIIVPDDVVDNLSKSALHGIGRLAYAATSTLGVEEVAIVKSSVVPAGIRVFSGWNKTSAKG